VNAYWRSVGPAAQQHLAQQLGQILRGLEQLFLAVGDQLQLAMPARLDDGQDAVDRPSQPPGQPKPALLV
jgi:hypothetical protein